MLRRAGGLWKAGIALLLTVLLAVGQEGSPPESILRFQLGETSDTVLRSLGGGASVVHLRKLDLYEFRRADQDAEEEPDWRFTFLLPKKQLIAVTRNYEKAIDVTKLFPVGETELKFYPDEEDPAVSFLVRILDSRRLLLARLEKGSRKMADQLVLASPGQAALMFPFLAHPSQPSR
jgi:hypothetical protein